MCGAAEGAKSLNDRPDRGVYAASAWHNSATLRCWLGTKKAWTAMRPEGAQRPHPCRPFATKRLKLLASATFLPGNVPSAACFVRCSDLTAVVPGRLVTRLCPSGEFQEDG